MRKITVVVPVYKQWHHLRALLAGFDAQTLSPTEFDLILVANEPLPDGYTPPETSFPVTLCACLKPGSYAARNFGASLAESDLLTFTDADCRPDPDFLRQLLIAHEKLPAAILAGRVGILPAEHRTLWSDYDCLRGIPQERYVARGYGACANLTVPRALFDADGGFDETRLSGGDAEFCRRLSVPVLYVGEAVVTHPCRETFSDVWCKARRVRGGQIRSGPLRRRAAWTVLSFLPPFRESGQLWRVPFPIQQRVRAILAQNLLWACLMAESLRLLFRGEPERR
ncbi:glycosyltransferase family 2 protein [Celeribacter persicus]|uniref:Glycosyltransferase 2-like domain-containing protein n=1 Tax=Celeribacter persicus TaxID=1651082 RepID=A0A2T5HTS2_9RHOB|nr:glycosyltransferase [Celeribacter persicus]PTQ74992.1 hypothetical protein C8N42_103285 [Celeribacter persicus]